jgi:hypothetical protein
MPFVSAARETTFSVPFIDSTQRLRQDATVSDNVQAGVLFPVSHMRAVHRLYASALAQRDRYYAPAGLQETREYVALRVGAATTTAQRFGYSISPERGVSLGGGYQITRAISTSTGYSSRTTADARAYLPGVGPHHVVALRGAVGRTDGSQLLLQPFTLGGPVAYDALSFDNDGLGLMRGFPLRSFGGDHIAVVNADYRWPIAHPQRGIGTWPVFLHSIHAAVAGDAGQTWSGSFRPADLKVSFAGELSFDTRLAFGRLPITWTLGVGVGRDRATDTRDSTVYLRTGYAF